MATEPLETLIARAIADSGVPWWGPGAACVDPETGAAWRLTGATWGWTPDNEVASAAEEAGTWMPGRARALAAGPKLDDPGSVGVLLGLLGDDASVAWADGREPAVWWCYRATGPGYYAATRAEAIARAWIAAHGVALPPAEPAEVGGEGGSDG